MRNHSPHGAVGQETVRKGQTMRSFIALLLLTIGTAACASGGSQQASNSAYGRTYGNGSEASMPSDCDSYDHRPECFASQGTLTTPGPRPRDTEAYTEQPYPFSQ